jgi:phospholipase C
MEDEARSASTTVTRRQALRELGAAGVGLGALGGGLDALLAQAASAAPRHGSLKDIEHVVILIQENRSFDHYFGKLSGVRGFDDKHGRGAFSQRAKSGHVIKPFHLPKQCLPDISHEWGAQHRAWHGGTMDGWITAHEKANGEAIAPQVMGYHTRSDLHLYYALADAFTICDHYHCSVIGPTDPNRLMSISATLDPHGKHGGPLLETHSLPSGRGPQFSWTTMPERLDAHAVSWKNYSGGSGFLDNPLTYFKHYKPGTKLNDKATKPTYPGDFVADIAHNRLPQVSWLYPSVSDSEHPGFSTALNGQVVVRDVCEALFSHPKVWAKTALFITWDENGGFFDHVPPPTPPKGTKDEFVTVSKLPAAAEGIRGPIGLGFRVPMLIVSPFSRGGLVCSDTFDHTSTLRFLETRFGVQVPNLSRWRRGVTGDLTSAFDFATAPKKRAPSLPRVVGSTPCGSAQPVKVPSHVSTAHQERGKRRRPSGIVKR